MGWKIYIVTMVTFPPLIYIFNVISIKYKLTSLGNLQHHPKIHTYIQNYQEKLEEEQHEKLILAAFRITTKLQ